MCRDYSLQVKGLARPCTLCTDNGGLDNTGRDRKHVPWISMTAYGREDGNLKLCESDCRTHIDEQFDMKLHIIFQTCVKGA